MNALLTETLAGVRVGPTVPTCEDLEAAGHRAIGMAMTGQGEQAAAMMRTIYAAAAGSLREKEAKE